MGTDHTNARIWGQTRNPKIWLTGFTGDRPLRVWFGGGLGTDPALLRFCAFLGTDPGPRKCVVHLPQISRKLGTDPRFCWGQTPQSLLGTGLGEFWGQIPGFEKACSATTLRSLFAHFWIAASESVVLRRPCPILKRGFTRERGNTRKKGPKTDARSLFSPRRRGSANCRTEIRAAQRGELRSPRPILLQPATAN